MKNYETLLERASQKMDVLIDITKGLSIVEEHQKEERLDLLGTKKSSFKKAKKYGPSSFNGKRFKSKKSKSLTDLFRDLPPSPPPSPPSNIRAIKRRGARRRHSLSAQPEASNHSPKRQGKRQQSRKSRSKRRLQIQKEVDFDNDKAREIGEQYLHSPKRYRSVSEPPTEKMRSKPQLPYMLYWL